MGSATSCQADNPVKEESPLFSFLKKPSSILEGNKGFGVLKLDLDKPYYFPGDFLRGLAIVETNTNFPGRFLYLRIKGIEKFLWEETLKTELNTEGRNHKSFLRKGSKVHYHHEYVLYSWPFDIVPAGKYVIPFCIRLKKNLPGTFNFKKEDFEAKNSYSIKMVLSSNAEHIPSLSKQKFISIWPLIDATAPFPPSEEKSIITEFMTCYCFGQGAIKLSCSLDKLYYTSSDQLAIFFEIDNRSSNIDVEYFEIKFERILRINDDEGRKFVMKRILYTTKTDGIGAWEDVTGMNRRMVNIELESINKEASLPPSSKGSITSCEYIIFVKGHTDSWTRKTNEIYLQIPVNIISDELLVPPEQINLMKHPFVTADKEITEVFIELTDEHIYSSEASLQN